MFDQAQKLRELVREREHQAQGHARVIVVAAGKEGDGKTTIALNLAVVFEELGRTAAVLYAGMPEAEIAGQISDLSETKDIIIIDTCSDAREDSLALCEFADEVLVVTTAEAESYTRAYAFLKTLAGNGSTASLGIIVNQSFSPDEADRAGHNMVRVCHDFIDLDIRYWGHILRDPDVVTANRLKESFLLRQPGQRSPCAVQSCGCRIHKFCLSGV